ncbi:hypothetical protein DAEQUDRAFT_733596 [Daedalea quercina L-15889]|uniref:Ubiquitin-domain-containing protein n=1 Tax=Daedalea quercina L-15889 TaxID=1314783 RepID=A0A165KVD0_9APHY|nr:hypothetical protein DAEQUDRAFT_733596 [Daedalea quercina L-15889]
MSTDAPPASEIQINVKGPSELKLQITISTDKTVADLKQAIADKSDVSADRQRLIYSGRVLKDEDALSTYKIQSSHTIHMVKGAARNGASSSQGPPPQALPQMQAGQNVHDPLTQLNGHLGYGVMAGLNPFAELGLNTNDPNMMQGMLNNPAFLQQMSSVMSNPAVLDQIIASNPQLASMAPQVRQVFQSEQFRQMMSNPDSLRLMLQMSNAMRGGGLGGAQGGPSSFPAPGLPSTARQQGQDGQQQPPLSTGGTGGAPPPNPAAGFSGLFPFLPPVPGGSNPTSPGGTSQGTAGGAGAFDPALMQQMLAAMGGGAGGLGGAGGADPFGLGAFGGLGGLGAFGGAPAAPADSRPPEERFQVQLQQLQDMGFTNAQQNVRALLATGGNVHSAIEYILGGGGL